MPHVAADVLRKRVEAIEADQRVLHPKFGMLGMLSATVGL